MADSNRSDRCTDKLPTDFLFYNDINPALNSVSISLMVINKVHPFLLSAI